MASDKSQGTELLCVGHCCFLVLPEGSLWCWPQVSRCHLPLRAQSSASSHQPLPRFSEDGFSGESRARGRARPSARSSRSLQQQPQRCQLESQRCSQDVFLILFLVTSAFTLHIPPGCPSSVGLSRVREAQGWPRPELSLSPTLWGTEGHPSAPSSQHLTVCCGRNQPPPGLSQGRDRG